MRNVFVIGPDKKIKLMLVYPMTTGRNFDEVLRVIDSLQLTASHKVSTPAQWSPGEDVIIAGSVSNDEAKELFGEWEEPKPYIRIVPDPSKVRPEPEQPGGCRGPPHDAVTPSGGRKVPERPIPCLCLRRRWPFREYDDDAGPRTRSHVATAP